MFNNGFSFQNDKPSIYLVYLSLLIVVNIGEPFTEEIKFFGF